MSGSSALHAASLSMAVALPSNKVQMGLLGDGDDVGLGLRWASVIVGTCNCPYHSPSYVPTTTECTHAPCTHVFGLVRLSNDGVSLWHIGNARFLPGGDQTLTYRWAHDALPL